ncbi:MAG: hypothetical protein IPK52_27315 [Chloroflexi bacterium]|nr:hypothetical protein [Chloroflexota bacterium]
MQPKQIVFAWRYLVLAVDVVHLDLKWDWSQRMNQAHLMPIFEHWALETVILGCGNRPSRTGDGKVGYAAHCFARLFA